MQQSNPHNSNLGFVWNNFQPRNNLKVPPRCYNVTSQLHRGWEGRQLFGFHIPPPQKNMKFEQALCSIFQGCKKDPGQRYFLRGGGVDTEICGEFFGKVQLFQWNITDGALQLHLPQRPSQTQFRVILNFPQREQLRWEPDWTHQEGSTVLALTLIGSHENNSLVTARQNK